MNKPIRTRRNGGEYSTVLSPDGIIETMFFPDDPARYPRVVARTASIERAHREAIAHDMIEQEQTNGPTQ